MNKRNLIAICSAVQILLNLLECELLNWKRLDCDCSRMLNNDNYRNNETRDGNKQAQMSAADTMKV
jgi:hypothetical protein